MNSSIDAGGLTALFDLRQPMAYLALHPTLALAREEGVSVNWLPVRIAPLKPPSKPGPDDDRSIRHRCFRAQEIAREISTYAEGQELVLRDYYRDPDPSAVNVSWLWVREHAPEKLDDYLVEIFRAYWAVEFDPSDAEAVAQKVAWLGVEASGFEAWRRERGLAAWAALEEEIAERGLDGGSPAYWIDGEFFWGGQHLEMIRWILGGREGRGPI